MKRGQFLIALCAAMLASCQDTASDDKAEAVLLVHWAEGGADYAREYRTLLACRAAQRSILHDYARRGALSADAAASGKTNLPVEPRPIAICLPG